MTDKPTPAPGEFFAEGVIHTSRADVYKAPEDVLEFDARHLTTTPQGDKIMFGFARWEDEDWQPTGFGLKDWDMRSWYIKEGAW